VVEPYASERPRLVSDIKKYDDGNIFINLHRWHDGFIVVV